jgi:hypothetical protein
VSTYYRIVFIVFKLTVPNPNSLLASSVRVDGRAFAACRDMQLSSDIVHTVLSSASISIGRTVVIAGVQAVPGRCALIPLAFNHAFRS